MSSSSAPGALLLCVDAQPAFVSTMAQPALLQRRCALALAAARGLGIPVAFTEQVPHKLGGTAPDLLALAPDAPVWAKTSFSALEDEAIREALRAAEVEHLLLCGLETPVCVYQTALGALDADLHVTVLSDAVGARRPGDADHALAALARAGVHVLPVETVFYSLLHDAGHPFFKSFTQLVKQYG